MISIFNLSNDNGYKSTKKSDKLITFWYEKLTNNKINKETIEKLVHPVRKSAHIIIYLILGLLFISLLYEFTIPIKIMITSSILFCLVYACTDEIHQLFVIGRSGEVKDIILDTIGSTIGIFIYYLYKSKTEVIK